MAGMHEAWRARVESPRRPPLMCSGVRACVPMCVLALPPCGTTPRVCDRCLPRDRARYVFGCRYGIKPSAGFHNTRDRPVRERETRPFPRLPGVFVSLLTATDRSGARVEKRCTLPATRVVGLVCVYPSRLCQRLARPCPCILLLRRRLLFFFVFPRCP